METVYVFVVKTPEGVLKTGVMKSDTCPIYVDGNRVLRCIETTAEISGIKEFINFLRESEILEMFENFQI